jgi:hypothetical protein
MKVKEFLESAEADLKVEMAENVRVLLKGRIKEISRLEMVLNTAKKELDEILEKDVEDVYYQDIRRY